MTTTPIRTFQGTAPLTNASGFFYRRGPRLFLATSRHVFLDETSEHRPDRIEIELHIDGGDIARCVDFSIELYLRGMSVWRDARDRGGPIDVAAIEIAQDALPASVALQAFEPGHQVRDARAVEIGSNVLIVGFPLGFQDRLHHMPIARHAIVASSFGLRFDGKGYFLTNARTHRGISGAPVVMRMPDHWVKDDLAWSLLGVHSTRLDIGTRDLTVDEALGLNCAWYADVLDTLTAA